MVAVILLVAALVVVPAMAAAWPVVAVVPRWWRFVAAVVPVVAVPQLQPGCLRRDWGRDCGCSCGRDCGLLDAAVYRGRISAVLWFAIAGRT